VQREFIFAQAQVPSCHASTIVEAGDGLVCAWFAGTREGASDVGIWVSRCSTDGWSEPCQVATGWHGVRRYPCWNPVLHRRPAAAASLDLYYKVGPSPRRWWGMRLRSGDGGRTWSAPERLAHGILGPIKNKPITVADGTLLAPSSCERRRWCIHIERSGDGGETWHRGAPLNDGRAFAAIQPTLLPWPDGRLQLLCRTRQGVIAQAWSEDAGHHWSPLAATHLPNPDSGIDAVMLADGRALLVYNHSQTARSPLNLAVSGDGETWQAAQVLEAEPGEFSYPAIIEDSRGEVHVTYTWNRRRIRRAIIGVKELSAVAIESGHWPDAQAVQPGS
jgi:predicted neuraminidase